MIPESISGFHTHVYTLYPPWLHTQIAYTKKRLLELATWIWPIILVTKCRTYEPQCGGGSVKEKLEQEAMELVSYFL